MVRKKDIDARTKMIEHLFTPRCVAIEPYRRVTSFFALSTSFHSSKVSLYPLYTPPLHAHYDFNTYKPESSPKLGSSGRRNEKFRKMSIYYEFHSRRRYCSIDRACNYYFSTFIDITSHHQRSKRLNNSRTHTAVYPKTDSSQRDNPGA